MILRRLISIFLLCSLWTASLSTPSYAGQIFDPTGGHDNPVFTGVSSFPNGTQAAPSGIFTGITDRGFYNDTTNNRFGIAEGLSLPGGQLVLTALSTPGAPTVTVRGTAGVTTYTYKIVATNGSGTTDAGVAGSTATGNATLSATNYNELSWTVVTGATGYKVYRTVGGATQGLISTINSGATVTVNDTGLAGGGETPEANNATGRILVAAGSASYPSIGWQTDDDGTGTGFHRNAANNIGIDINGALHWIISSTGIANDASAGGPVIKNVTSTATVPTISPHSGSTITGIGGTVGTVSIIASSTEAVRVTDTGAGLGSTLGITSGSGTGLTVNEYGLFKRNVHKVTVTFAALAAAGLTADKTIATLPAKTRLVGIIADTTTTYTGGGVTAATLIVGKTVGGNEYIVSHDVFTAAVTKGLADADLGTSINRANAVQTGDLPSFTATTNISVRLTTVTANTNQLTQGSTTYYLITEAMP